MSALVALWVMLVAPAARAVTVTVWRVAQSAVLKVSGPDTVAAAAVPLVGVIVTSAVG